MSKQVEKFEQMLAEDPRSTAFVELARALIDAGDNDRAMQVCLDGLTHHPQHIVGRVLLGKALINAGRAADAMTEFDKAIHIEKDNPHAYNLISELLLRKGLYRSAIPILRKAVALQPADTRIKQWMDQAKAALAGGPAPVLYDSTSVDTQALPPQPVVSAAPAPVPGPPYGPDGAQTTPYMPIIAPEPPSTSQKNLAKVGDPAPPPVPSAPPASTGGPGGPTTVGPVPDLFAAFDTRPLDPSAQPTVVTKAYDGSAGAPAGAVATTLPEIPVQSPNMPAPPVPTGELPLVGGPIAERVTAEIPAQGGPADGRVTRTDELPLVGGPIASPAAAAKAPAKAGDDAPDPFAALMGTADGNDTFRGLTSTFSALEQGTPQVNPNEPSVSVSPELLRAQTPSPGGPPRLEPVGPPVPSAPSPVGGGLLDDVLSVQSEIPTSELAVPNAGSPPDPAAAFVPRTSAPGRGGLLDEIPDEHAEPHAPVTIPRADTHHHQHAEKEAKQFEEELRKKLEASRQKKTFLQKHGMKLGLGAALLVVLGGLGGSFIYTRLKHKGENLDSSVGKGLAAISADTKEQYVAAIEALDRALEMDDSSKDAWAYRGFASAVLYGEHGNEAKRRDDAKAAWERSGVREAHADLAAVSDYLLADAAGAKAARQALLDSTLDASAVNAQAGRVLLDDKKFEDALKRLSKAVEQDSHNVRALVWLGDYYLAFEDYENAYTVLSGPAAQLSKSHPLRVIGLAQARVELGREVPEALTDLEALPKSAAVPVSLAGRYTLWLGRAQSANGKHEDALKTLEQGLAKSPAMAFDFHMALGQASRAGGVMERAQKEFEAALKLDAKSEAAKEGLGRTLLARSREKELLDRLRAEKDQRKVALVRGIAWSRLGDAKKARAELANTQVGGKYPAEAVVYLSLADAADEGAGDKAVTMLEKLATQTKRNKATVQVALARVYMQKGQLDKARAQLEEAAKDPQDYEGNALLGELLVNAGLPNEVAVEPLVRAVERNGSHAPARHLLTRLLLDMGRFADAQKNVDAWTADNPSLEQAWRDAALVGLQTGHLKEAEQALGRGMKADSDDTEAWRLKARIGFGRGDGKGAFAALERANKLNPKDAETFCEIGNAFVRQGVPDMALKAYEAALREDAKSVCGRVGPFHAFPSGRGRAAVQGLLKDSKRAWDKAFLLATLARIQAAERNMKDARSTVDEATTLAPGHPAAWFAAGEVARAEKDGARAVEAYGKSAELDGAWTAPHLALADELTKVGKESWPRAITEYELVANATQNEGEQGRASKAAQALRKQLK